jgi:hypothetical protein
MVDAAHADAVARGSLILGTLGGYAELEAARAGRSVVAQPPGWAFCMMVEGCRYDPTPETPKAFFEVQDMQLLMQFAMRQHELQIAGGQSDLMRYEGAEVGQPFTKDAAFAEEREVRMVFRPRPGVTVDRPLITRPDYAVAGLLRRID